ncbi:MAG TPA: FecR domain-containing protein [Opitutaceae bacterium]|nr:FecR domain-containing protein [Opitutaceae bacterium]
MNSSSPNREAIADEQAALWAARLDGSPLSAADRTALDAWLAETPAHRTLLSNYCQFSADLEQQLPVLVETGAVAMPAKPSASRPAWRARWFAGIAVAAAALVVLSFWITRPVQQFQAISTAVAQRQSVTLSDGTRVELNARTSLRVEFTRAERRVRLADGEAFFTVSKDASRPFIVETPTGSVRVTGTVFNVRTETAAMLDVVVVEGSVQVSPGAIGSAPAPAPDALVAGDRLTATPKGVVKLALSASDRDDLLAWREGRIVFNGVPLPVALARFAHYHGRSLTASPAAIAAGHSVGGQYSIDDLDGFLAAQVSMKPFKVTRDANGSVRISLRSEP